jgi:arylsulfatase A-like enzyme
VDTWDPHEPWDAPDYLGRLYKPDFVGPAPYPPYGKWEERGLTHDDLATGHAAYCAEVTLMDRWVGGLIEKLDLLQLAENTYVIFTSDHGFYFGEHELFGKAEIFGPTESIVSPGAEAPDWFVKVGYHTQGWSPLYGELVCLPLLIRGPLVKHGRRSALTTAPDIPATILDLAGVEAWRTMHGKPFRAALTDDAPSDREFVVSSWPLYFARGEWTRAIDSKPREITSFMPITIRNGSYSVIYTGPGHPTELYDLASDRNETRNVWSENLDQGVDLVKRGLNLLEELGTAEEYLTPRAEALSQEARGPRT